MNGSCVLNACTSVLDLRQIRVLTILRLGRRQRHFREILIHRRHSRETGRRVSRQPLQLRLLDVHLVEYQTLLLHELPQVIRQVVAIERVEPLLGHDLVVIVQGFRQRRVDPMHDRLGHQQAQQKTDDQTEHGTKQRHTQFVEVLAEGHRRPFEQVFFADCWTLVRTPVRCRHVNQPRARRNRPRRPATCAGTTAIVEHDAPRQCAEPRESYGGKLPYQVSWPPASAGGATAYDSSGPCQAASDGRRQVEVRGSGC